MADDQDTDSEVTFNINNHHNPDNDDHRDIGDHDYGVRGDNVGHPRPKRRSTNVKPDIFTGEEDWEQYISYFEDCSELADWTEREELLFLATSLKGQARVHYCSLPAEEKRSFRTLVTSLEQRFGNRRQATRWIAKLQSRHRAKNETVAAFGDEIRLYAQKAYAALDQEAQELLALQQFYNNVSPEMKCRLMDRECRTIREAVEIVERYEDVIGRTDQPSRVRGAIGPIRDGKVQNDREAATDMSAIRDSIAAIADRLTKLEDNDRVNRSTTPLTCFHCGKHGHVRRFCPNLKYQSSKNKPGNGKPSHQ